MYRGWINDNLQIECQYELLLDLGDEVKILNVDTGTTFDMKKSEWENLVKGVESSGYFHKVERM